MRLVALLRRVLQLQGIKVDLAGNKNSRWDIKCSSWDIKSSRWDIKVQKINQHNSGRKTAFFGTSSPGHPTNPHPATLVVLSWLKPLHALFILSQTGKTSCRLYFKHPAAVLTILKYNKAQMRYHETCLSKRAARPPFLHTSKK